MAGAANPDGGGQKFSQKKAVYTIACTLVKSWQSAEFRISSRPEHSRCWGATQRIKAGAVRRGRFAQDLPVCRRKSLRLHPGRNGELGKDLKQESDTVHFVLQEDYSRCREHGGGLSRYKWAVVEGIQGRDHGGQTEAVALGMQQVNRLKRHVRGVNWIQQF